MQLDAVRGGAGDKVGVSRWFFINFHTISSVESVKRRKSERKLFCSGRLRVSYDTFNVRTFASCTALIRNSRSIFLIQIIYKLNL